MTRLTRDQLARQARDRGMSLSALLAEIARERDLDEVFRSEREATLADRGNPAATREAEEWDAAPLDEPL